MELLTEYSDSDDDDATLNDENRLSSNCLVHEHLEVLGSGANRFTDDGEPTAALDYFGLLDADESEAQEDVKSSDEPTTSATPSGPAPAHLSACHSQNIHTAVTAVHHFPDQAVGDFWAQDLKSGINQQSGYGTVCRQSGFGAVGQESGYRTEGQQSAYGTEGQQSGYRTAGQQSGYMTKVRDRRWHFDEHTKERGDVTESCNKAQSLSHIAKRHRFQTASDGTVISQTQSSKRKSPYHVHHEVAPFLHGKCNSRVPHTKQLELKGHAGPVNRIQWCCPDYSHLLVSASMDGTVRIWNVMAWTSSSLAVDASQQSVQVLDVHTKGVKDAAWSSTARHIASAAYDNTACVSDVEKGIRLSQYPHDGPATCCCYHPVQPNVLVTGTTNCILCWDTRNVSGKPVRTYKYKDALGQVQDIAFLRDGSQFFTCSDLVSRESADRNIMAWDFHKAVVLSNQIYQERYTCTRLKVHPWQRVFVAQTQANYIAEFSTTKPYKMNKSKRYEGHQVSGYDTGCDFSPDGQLLISGSCDGTAHIYSTRQARCIHTLTSSACSPALDVSWHPVLSSTVAMSFLTGLVAIWN